MNNLPKVVAQQRRGRASNPRLLDRKSDALPLSHRATRSNHVATSNQYDARQVAFKLSQTSAANVKNVKRESVLATRRVQASRQLNYRE